MTLYSIKDLEHLSGIKAHTIRIWEKRYSLLDPVRTDTNIRSYSDEDVRRLLNVAMLVKNGYKISAVALFDDARIKTEILRIDKNMNEPDLVIDRLLYYTVNLNTVDFELLLDELIQQRGLAKTVQEVVFSFFERIGILWQTGSIFSAQEHMVSNLIRKKLICETAKLNPVVGQKSALFFLHENEMHELGLLFSAYLATAAGLRCVYLGQNVPFTDLSDFLASFPFDFVCTSFVHAIEKVEFEQYLANLSLVFNQGKILISGRQVGIHNPKLPANVFVIKNSNDFAKRISA